MPRLIVYDTDRKVTTNFTIAFARGAIKHNNETNGPWEVKHMPIKHYMDNGLLQDLLPGVDAVATLGILRGTGMMLKEAQRKGIDYYYMDHAYFNPGYNGKGWMRITKNGHSCTTLRESDNSRWKGFHKHAGYAKEPWKTNSERGSKIIICPPTNAVSWYMGIEYDWEQLIVGQLKAILPANEHSRIVVRRKPKEPIVDARGFLKELRVNPQDGSLAEDLLDAHCVIAYNSMVALEATLKGIPVITGEISPCARVSFSIDDFRSGPMPEVFNEEPLNRQAMLNWLAHNQWKMRDIENGKAWKELQENYSGI